MRIGKPFSCLAKQVFHLSREQSSPLAGSQVWELLVASRIPRGEARHPWRWPFVSLALYAVQVRNAQSPVQQR